jgi:hypothetical protein
MNITYETDYYAWAIDQAAKLRAGRFARTADTHQEVQNRRFAFTHP